MKRIFLTAIVAAGLATAAQAGVDSGERAYLAGDYRMALDELLPLAREGDSEAQYIVGVMHDHGDGVARDYAAAASWYEKAAGQGHDLAAFSLDDAAGKSGWCGFIHPFLNLFAISCVSP